MPGNLKQELSIEEYVNALVDEKGHEKAELIPILHEINAEKGYISDDAIKALSKKPDYAEAFYTRAKIHENLKEFRLAINDLKKAKSLFPSTGFIDAYIFRIKTRRLIPKDEAAFPNDATVYLKNGRRIQGRLKSQTKETVFLDVFVGNSFGTIMIRQQDIKLLQKMELW